MDKLRPILIGFLLMILCSNSVFTNPAEQRIDNTDYVYDDDDDSASSETNNVSDGHDITLSLTAESYATAASVGENLELDCAKYVYNFNESKDVLLIWYNGSTMVTQDSKILSQDKRIKLGHNNNLIIDNIQNDDINNYTCQVLPDKLNLTVRVQITPTINILNNGRNVMGNELEYKEGSNIEIDCISDSKTPIVWSLLGNRVEHIPGITVDNSKMLIKHANHSHTGVYQCLADGIETVAIGSLNISIKVHPKVSTPRQYVNVKDGLTKELKCTFIASTPIEKIIWKKDDITIEANDKYQMFDDITTKHKRRTNLIITDIVKEDLGRYRCEIINGVGKGHADITLIYVPEPAHFDSYEVNENHLHINWTIHSYQQLSDISLYYQLKSGLAWQTDKPFHHHNDDNGIWKIQHRVRLEEGTWSTKIKSTNSFGQSEFSEEKVIVIPNNSNEIPVISEDGKLEQQQRINGANNINQLIFLQLFCGILFVINIFY